MTTQKQLPVEATEEPQIQSPDQEADRGRQAAALSAVLQHEGDPLTLADPDNPLRMPGEMTARPRSAEAPDRTSPDTPEVPK
jgi:hypothetical protein